MPVPRKLLFVSAQPCPPDLDAHLRQRHWELVPARNLRAARSLLRHEPVLVALLHVDTSARDLSAEFEACRAASDLCEWVAVLPPGALEAPGWRELVLLHCFDHHTQPADPEFLAQSLGHAHGRALLRASVAAPAADDLGLVGRSTAMVQLRRLVRRAGGTESPMLVEGESGTGKELVARAVHACSARRPGPCVVLDCAARHNPPQEAFDAAAGGTLVLDHASDMPLDWQARLLRYLAEKAVLRAKLGADAGRDARVIALSEQPLADAVAAKRFRQDLYFRLNVVALVVPPLRRRKDDVVPLAQHFHAQAARHGATGARGFSREALAALEAHAWPGNVRELASRVERAVVLAERRLIGAADLGLDAPAPQPGDSLEALRVQAEREAIATSLDRASHNVSLAARELGVSRMTMYRLMAKHRIAPRSGRDGMQDHGGGPLRGPQQATSAPSPRAP